MSKEGNKVLRISSYVTLVIFLFMIMLGTALSILKKDVTFSVNENRLLQQMPEFSTEAFFSGKFTKEYETYVTDQFVMRDQWIAFKTNMERVLQKKDINGVYFAKDDYLIERHDPAKIDKEQVEKNLERLTQFMKTAERFVEKDQAHVMLVPTASQILKDKIPAFAVEFDQFAVIEELKSRLPVGSVIDVADTLMEHSNEEIYYRTDHHWTTLGAYYAYREFMKASGMEPFLPEDYKITEVTDQFFGTISSKVNVNVKPDRIYLYEKLGNKGYQVQYNQTETTNTLFNLSSLETKDKYTVFLNGNNALVKITGGNKNGRKLLVIKDSFSHCFVPFLVDQFEEVQMVDFRYFRKGITEFMEEEDFTDVLVLYNVINFVEDKNTITFVR